MHVRRWFLPALLALVLGVLAPGCGKAQIRYAPNEVYAHGSRFDRVLAVVPFTDSRPSWENVPLERNATSDARIEGRLSTGITRAVSHDLSASRLFKQVLVAEEENLSDQIDLVLYGDVRHFYGVLHEEWLEWPDFCFLFLGAPLYWPHETAGFALEVRLRLVRLDSGRTIWENTLQRRWSYGPMTAWEFIDTYGFLYEQLSLRLKDWMAAAMRDMEIALGTVDSAAASNPVSLPEE